nr:hypothetical protein [uncultured bacterium]
MTSKAALFALLALWGIGGAAALPAMAEDLAATTAEDSTDADISPLKRSLANRVWVKTDSGDLPSVIRIFLSDGTMVSDSCWETHRLSPWHMTSDDALTWNEDGIDITAEIVKVSAAELLLRISLRDGSTIDELYRPADVPYVCPDIPA